jgi:hypothetical protein
MTFYSLNYWHIYVIIMDDFLILTLFKIILKITPQKHYLQI